MVFRFPRLSSIPDYTGRVKKRRLMQDGSPVFTQDCSDIAASASELFGFENTSPENKFLPLNFVRIVNNGGTDLKIYLNQTGDGEIILNDTIYTNTGAFRSFILENTDSSNSVDGGNVFITVQRKPGGF